MQEYQSSEPTDDVLQDIGALISGSNGEPVGKDTPETAPEAADPEGREAEHSAESEASEPETDEDEGVNGIDYDMELEIPIASGEGRETVTLGALKDYYQDREKHVVELQKRENDVMRQTDQIRELSQYIQLSPEQQQRINAIQSQTLQAETAAMLDAIPEWRDQGAFIQGREAISDLARDYDLERELPMISNHKVIKLLHDYASLRARVTGARENTKPRSKQAARKGRDGGAKASKTTKRDEYIRRQVSAGEDRAVAEVDALLRGLK